MKREDCWMTFSEALEKYLEAREGSRHFGPGRNRDDCLEDMRTAAEHMDALTSVPNVKASGPEGGLPPKGRAQP